MVDHSSWVWIRVGDQLPLRAIGEQERALGLADDRQDLLTGVRPLQRFRRAQGHLGHEAKVTDQFPQKVMRLRPIRDPVGISIRVESAELIDVPLARAHVLSDEQLVGRPRLDVLDQLLETSICIELDT